MSTAQDHGSRASTNRAAASAAPQRRRACRGAAASNADVPTRCKLKGVSHSWRAGARRVLCARVPAEFDRPARRALPEGGWACLRMVDVHAGLLAPDGGAGMYGRHVCGRGQSVGGGGGARRPARGAAPARAPACMRRGHVCSGGVYAAACGGGMDGRSGGGAPLCCATTRRGEPESSRGWQRNVYDSRPRGL